MLHGLRTASALAFALVFATVSQLPAVSAQTQPDELDALEARVQQLHRAGKYAEGIPLAERYLALAKSRHGEEHPKYASGLHDLGVLYRHQGRYAEAEPLLTRALVIAEKAERPDHLHVGIALNSLALLYQVHRRFAEAGLLKRALAIGEKALGPDHPTGVRSSMASPGFIKRNSALRKLSSFSNARSRSRKKRGVRTTPMWRGRSAASPCFMPSNVAMRKLGRSISASSRSGKRPWVPIART